MIPSSNLFSSLSSLNGSEAAALKHELLRAACTEKLSTFVKTFWPMLEPTRPLVWNWHMDVMCDAMQECDERVFAGLPKLHDLIINVPPGSTKTKICSELATAWEFARMPGIRVYIGSYSDGVVGAIADNVRMIIKSPLYQRLFPAVNLRKDRSSLTLTKTTQNGEFYVYTFGGAVTGKHADILKIDDPLNPKQAASEPLLQKSKDFFDQTLPTRKTNKEVTYTALIMQRLADGDPSGHLLKKKSDTIRHIQLPGCLSFTDKDGNTSNYEVKPAELRKNYVDGLLDPNRLKQATLNEMWRDLGPAIFAGQVGQAPAPPGGLIWKETWFIPVPDFLMPSRDHMTAYGSDWDTAYTKNKDNSATAYVTSGRIGGRVYIDDCGFDWLEFNDMVAYIKARRGPHYIEQKASGISAKQVLTKAGIACLEVPVQGGADKEARANLASPIAARGDVYVRESVLAKLLHDPTQGVLKFPRGEKTDLADALAQALQRHNQQGVKVLGTQEQSDPLAQLQYGMPYDQQPAAAPVAAGDPLEDLFNEPWEEWQ